MSSTLIRRARWAGGVILMILLPLLSGAEDLGKFYVPRFSTCGQAATASLRLLEINVAQLKKMFAQADQIAQLIAKHAEEIGIQFKPDLKAPLNALKILETNGIEVVFEGGLPTAVATPLGSLPIFKSVIRSSPEQRQELMEWISRSFIARTRVTLTQPRETMTIYKFGNRYILDLAPVALQEPPAELGPNTYSLATLPRRIALLWAQIKPIGRRAR